jgi:hypothetical protein
MNFDALPVNYYRPGSPHLHPKPARRGGFFEGLLAGFFAKSLNFQQKPTVNFYGLDGIVPAASERYLCEGKYWLLKMIRISLKSPA